MAKKAIIAFALLFIVIGATAFTNYITTNVSNCEAPSTRSIVYIHEQLSVDDSMPREYLYLVARAECVRNLLLMYYWIDDCFITLTGGTVNPETTAINDQRLLEATVFVTLYEGKVLSTDKSSLIKTIVASTFYGLCYNNIKVIVTCY